jgi:aminomethyltransferase
MTAALLPENGSRATPLLSRHVALGARMIDFGGWQMPVSYT